MSIEHDKTIKNKIENKEQFNQYVFLLSGNDLETEEDKLELPENAIQIDHHGKDSQKASSTYSSSKTY